MKVYIQDQKMPKQQAKLSAGSSAARSYPVSLVLSGEYLWGGGEQYRGKVYEQNTGGYWWTSLSSSNSDFADYAGTDSDELSQFSNTKTYGFPLRCVIPTAPLPRVVTRCPWCILVHISG